MRVHLLYYIAALTTVACSSNTVLEEVRPIDIYGDDPIAFTGVSETAMTRANAMPQNILRTGFVVSAFKNYGSHNWNATDNTVMPRFLVDYKENRDDWNGVVSSNWNYVNITNPWSNDRQEERFWDYSAFPYRFHAIAPANGNSISKVQIDGLGHDALAIHASYQAQTFTAPPSSGSDSPTTTITPSNKDAEPYLLAQVSRNANGEDRDIIKDKAINTESTTRNRRVWLPFHHLNSKVRFAIYTDNLMQTERVDYITDLTIWAECLATSANGYTAYGTDSWVTNTGYSYFSDITVNDHVEIFKYNHTQAGTPNRSYEQNNLSLHQSRSSAYFLECPDGIMQLPQTDVKLHITMKVMGTNGQETTHFYDYEITKDKNVGASYADPTHWQAGCIHTYYIHLNFENLMLPIITTTCTLTPWEDITGSLSTDLEQ